ncbi:hypothetical protein P7D22_20365 [Lichenihabitans sp. Uapishka_5]|uniref:hypothetical protein n=1 Tax=Lichenihabitans sp. Uapishka_5 TaxID=3037302 RepID=UPI0029E80841|nr:hypothetical protein [Lichenihabitans sp. Uapishka_5]MDX7953523.1 hypothetical protein [Lichenihabitans sp. Uapishka_5]
MADSAFTLTLSNKIRKIEAYLTDMEARVAAARRDLVHLQATAELFRRGQIDAPPAYMGLGKVFNSGEQKRLALKAMEGHPDGIDVRAIAEAVMAAKGVSKNEKAFRRTVIRSLTVTLGKAEARGQVRCVGKLAVNGVKVWALG